MIRLKIDKIELMISPSAEPTSSGCTTTVTGTSFLWLLNRQTSTFPFSSVTLYAGFSNIKVIAV